MMHQLQGRPGRRAVALAVLVVAAVGLWRGVWERPGRAATVVGDVRYVPSSFDWATVTHSYPVADRHALPAGEPSAFPRVQARDRAERDDDVAAARKEAVRRAFVKSWEAYKKHAWTRDELMPLSGKGRHSFSGWAAQLVDALDSLWIMGLKDDFYRAVREVAVTDFAKTRDGKPVNLFEVTIRYLGGLLSAYDLSREAALRAKAVELGDALYAAFDTPNRLPALWPSLDPAAAGAREADAAAPAAAVGSLSLEFTRLSQITGADKYYDATERVKLFLARTQARTKVPGLWPRVVDCRNESADGPVFSLGAGSDSLYEYLPKMHALLGGLDPQYGQMAVRALDAARDTLLFRPATPRGDNVLAAGSALWADGATALTPEMQHLTCFAGATYGLAGRLLARRDYVDLASRLTAGCVWAYDSFPTNLMPEIAELVACETLDGPCPAADSNGPRPDGRALPGGFTRVRDARYLLRPEAAESVFYMWRITGDEAWRDAAWRMWQGIVRETETELAFASIEDVRVRASAKVDSMETFWLAETLKYFYLIFDDEGVIDLDQWVLNTEAHPFRRPAAT